jgi:hypothetical protein
MFETKVVEKIKTHILCSTTFSRIWYHLCDNVEKYGTAKQATDGNLSVPFSRVKQLDPCRFTYRFSRNVGS